MYSFSKTVFLLRFDAANLWAWKKGKMNDSERHDENSFERMISDTSRWFQYRRQARRQRMNDEQYLRTHFKSKSSNFLNLTFLLSNEYFGKTWNRENGSLSGWLKLELITHILFWGKQVLIHTLGKTEAALRLPSICWGLRLSTGF